MCHIRDFIFSESSWFIKDEKYNKKQNKTNTSVFSFLTETEKERLKISCLYESNIQSIINLSFLWPTSLHLFSLRALIFSENPEQTFLKQSLDLKQITGTYVLIYSCIRKQRSCPMEWKGTSIPTGFVCFTFQRFVNPVCYFWQQIALTQNPFANILILCLNYFRVLSQYGSEFRQFDKTV